MLREFLEKTASDNTKHSTSVTNNYRVVQTKLNSMKLTSLYAVQSGNKSGLYYSSWSQQGARLDYYKNVDFINDHCWPVISTHKNFCEPWDFTNSPAEFDKFSHNKLWCLDHFLTLPQWFTRDNIDDIIFCISVLWTVCYMCVNF